MATPAQAMAASRAAKVAELAAAAKAAKGRFASAAVSPLPTPSPASASSGVKPNRIAELLEAVRHARAGGDAGGPGLQGRGPLGVAEALQSKTHGEASAALANYLVRHGGSRLNPLGAGADSVVLDAGDRVAKIGLGSPRLDELPQGVWGVLPYEDAASFGPFRVEFQKKVEQPIVDGRYAESFKKDMPLLNDLLGRQGWAWKDRAARNMGYRDNLPVVIDGQVLPLRNGRIVGGSLAAPKYEYPNAAIPYPFTAHPKWPSEFYLGIPRRGTQ